MPQIGYHAPVDDPMLMHLSAALTGLSELKKERHEIVVSEIWWEESQRDWKGACWVDLIKTH